MYCKWTNTSGFHINTLCYTHQLWWKQQFCEWRLFPIVERTLWIEDSAYIYFSFLTKWVKMNLPTLHIAGYNKCVLYSQFLFTALKLLILGEWQLPLNLLIFSYPLLQQVRTIFVHWDSPCNLNWHTDFSRMFYSTQSQVLNFQSCQILNFQIWLRSQSHGSFALSVLKHCHKTCDSNSLSI